MRPLPNLQDLLYRLAKAGIRDARLRQASNDQGPGRFPVTVKPGTRQFLEAEAEALNTSIAGLAGAILDAVAMTTLETDSGGLVLRSLAERLHVLLREHELSVPAAAELLEPLGIGLAELRSSEDLEVALTAKRLKEISRMFEARYDWLVGKSHLPLEAHRNCWYKDSGRGALRALRQVAEGWEVELTILRCEGGDYDGTSTADDTNGPEFIPVVTRSKTLDCGEELKVHQVWDVGDWSYRKARVYLKILVHFLTSGSSVYAGGGRRVQIAGRTLTVVEFNALKAEHIIPASILHRTRRIDWYPDDYVIPNSAVAKDPAEWTDILKGDEYKTEVRVFEAGLAELYPRTP